MTRCIQIFSIACMSALAFPAFPAQFSGVVLESPESPRAGASVWLQQRGEVRHAVSDTEGRFRFPDLESGPFDVVAFAEGHALAGVSGFARGDYEATLFLVDGRETRIRITAEDRNAAGGARLAFLRVNDRFNVYRALLAADAFPAARSDEDGYLALPPLPPGQAEVIVSHFKYADSYPVVLKSGGETRTVFLFEGIRLSGRVTSEGRPVADAAVNAEHMAEEDRWKPCAAGRSDPDGFYRLRLPGEGICRLTARHPEYAAAAPAILNPGGGAETVTRNLELYPPRIIEGRLLLPDDMPAAGVPVIFRGEEAVYAEGLTGMDGRFRLRARAGAGILNYRPPPGFITEVFADIQIDMKDARKTTLAPVRLERLPRLNGRIRLQNGDPAAGALVWTRETLFKTWVRADKEGRFHIQLTSAPEKGVVPCRAEDPFRFLRADFEIRLKKEKPADVKLEAFNPDTQVHGPIPGRNDLSGLIDEAAPELECAEWYNTENPVRLAQLRGKVVVLTFWAGFDTSPAGVNRIEMCRALEDIFREKEDVVILAVHDASSEAKEVERHIEDRRITFPAGRDSDPFVTFNRYEITRIPETVLIGRKGRVRYYEPGARLLELIKVLRRESP
jgi:peroxiredoxin